MVLATKFLGASFNGITLTAGEDDPTTNPDLALTTTEFFDPGIKLVSVYLVVTTDTNKASLTKTSYAFAPTTGFQDKSADTYPTLLVTNPVTSSLLIVKVLIDDQIFGDRYFLILTVYVENVSSFAVIAVLFDLTIFGLDPAFVNSTSK